MDAKYAKIASDLNIEAKKHTYSPPTARILTFESSPGLAATPKSRDELRTHQKSTTNSMWFRRAALFMSQKELNDYEHTHNESVASVLRVTEKKAQQTAAQSKMPTSWSKFDTAGPPDGTIEETIETLDAEYDWLATIAGAVTGTLVILVDCDLNLEGRQCVLRYQHITPEMLRMRFSPFSKRMNDYMRDHRDQLVYIPASTLVAQDRRIGKKILGSMMPETAKQVQDKARVLVARQCNIRHSGAPYTAVTDILLSTLRLGYKPDQDQPRKKELLKKFLSRPERT